MEKKTIVQKALDEVNKRPNEPKEVHIKQFIQQPTGTKVDICVEHTGQEPILCTADGFIGVTVVKDGDGGIDVSTLISGELSATMVLALLSGLKSLQKGLGIIFLELTTKKGGEDNGAGVL